jgi:hypothetical protein
MQTGSDLYSGVGRISRGNCFFPLARENSIGWPFLFGAAGCRLEALTFEPHSQLREIDAGAFFGCESLRTLCIPASVER